MDGVTVPPAGAFAFAAEPVHALLARTVQRHGRRPAINFLGRRWDWSEVGIAVDRAAAGLQRLGVGPGVNVGLCLPNTPYSIILYFAILKAGGTVVNFNPLYTAREIEAQAGAAKVRIIASIDLTIIQDKIGPLAAKGVFDQVILCSLPAALPPMKRLLFRLFKSGELAVTPAGSATVSFAALIAGGAQPKPVALDPLRAVAALQFTGGTTGTPKAVMLSHANIDANVKQILGLGIPLNAGAERVLGVLPLFHVFAMTVVMNLGVALGAEIFLLPRPDIKVIMKTIRRRRPTIMPAVPTLLTAISNAVPDGTTVDLSFIKFCLVGGAPTPAAVAAQYERVTGCPILEGYGLSETAPVVSVNRPGQARRGSVGPALPGTTIQIRDPEQPTRLLATGERGEICVAGPQVMLGYYNQPEETGAVFVEGALRTGDIGCLDAEGFLFIVDRIKDLIICGGYNVYPRAIEDAAYRHEAVHEAVAVGVPDEYRGEAPKLFLTLRAGAAVSVAEIRAFLEGQLSKIEMPREIEIRQSLPKTMIGKLSKKELAAEARAKRAPEDGRTAGYDLYVNPEK